MVKGGGKYETIVIKKAENMKKEGNKTKRVTTEGRKISK